MNMRKDENAQTTVELAPVELDEVSGGEKGSDVQINYLNWVKQIYSPWAGLRFGEGRILIC
ncbi:hypothetical protein JQ612_00700 [Bradyrhizobium manausense]|uniref:hypothetical protein n=1 Tax=Bradyrhizobium manausense TaxID=989370 RepID=UPI001BA6650F|nr:hypothetical protein [Bradyrhizobium manausense]MBR0726902.1 hypothetical protein [Bradyrhizobium manausense]MBR0831693.1 hypothetical protein [Bradyrhizobium manausense]